MNQNVSSNCFSIYWNIKPFPHIFWHLHRSGALPKAVLYLKSVKYTLVEFPHFAELWRKTNINNTPASNNYRSQVVQKWKDLFFLFCSNFVEENLKKKMLNLLCRKSAKHSQSTQSTLKIQIPRKMDEKQNAHSCCYSSDVERMEHVLQIKRISDTKKKKKRQFQTSHTKLGWLQWLYQKLAAGATLHIQTPII